MIHSIFVISELAEVVVEKHWRGVVSRSAVVDPFLSELNKAGSPEALCPILSTPRFSLVNSVHRTRTPPTLFFVACVGAECNPLISVEFLRRLESVLEEYLGTGFTDTDLAESFGTVTQLLDEMADGGTPLNTEPAFLKQLVRPPGLFAKLSGSASVSSELPSSTLTTTPWRRAGIRYTNNEVFFDMVEEVDAVLDNGGGGMVTCSVRGSVEVNCRLSGTPDLSLSFSNPGIIDDVSLHPCVRYYRWEQGRVLSFVPPDGKFRLMTYRVRGNVQPPISVRSQIRWTSTGAKVDVALSCKYFGGDPSKVFADEVSVSIPFPKTVASAALVCSVGSFNFDQKTKVVTWTIGKFPPQGRTPTLVGSVALAPGSPQPESNPVLSAQFKVVMYAASGLHVDSLLVNEKYRPFKGVRSLTRAGNYCVRS